VIRDSIIYRSAGLAGLALLGLAAPQSALAQQPFPFSAEARTHFDVPYVPTPQVTVDEMLRMGGVGPGDFVLDLGSGDGRIVVTAAQKFGARGLGVDLDPHLI
jgi:hypothetical protein